MPAKLLFTIICDDVRMENTQKAILVGVYNNVINFQKAATVPSAQKTVYAIPQLCLFRRWRLGSEPVNVQTQILGPEGFNRIEIPSTLQPPTEPGLSQEIVKLFGPVFVEGDYSIVTTVLGSETAKFEETFFVRMR
jgi:hypothetical protein